MKLTFSITSLLFLLTITAFGIRGWQLFQPLDHFELEITGALANKLPLDTTLRFVENPDYKRIVSFELEIDDLPATLPIGFSRRGCVVEFWSKVGPAEQKLFSVVLDRDLFDRFRVITLKLDKPTPEINADFDCWVTQRWSPNLTRRMRYLDLPWWNNKSQRLEPIPAMPKLVVTDLSNGEIVERCSLARQECNFTGHFAELAEKTTYSLRDGDTLEFSVEYDSGGLFDTTETKTTFKFNQGRHDAF